ncbi:MAG TPA: Uma2 family endonuclease [Acinetobacter sp.]|nr:Uma2 family endonuclease [Acinetobacter sp.]
MAVKQRRPYVSEQEYLDGEQFTEIKHEYINGEVYAMAGAHRNHVRLADNIMLQFMNHLKGKSCQPFSSDLKIKIGKNFFYPDVMVDCSDDEYDYYTESPTIIVEVLSKSTRQKDRTLKRDLYLTIPTLQEYVLIEQDFVDVEIQRRTNGWQSEHFYLDQDVYFQSIDLTVKVADIYDRVKNEDMQQWWAKKVEVAQAKQSENDLG